MTTTAVESKLRRKGKQMPVLPSGVGNRSLWDKAALARAQKALDKSKRAQALPRWELYRGMRKLGYSLGAIASLCSVSRHAVVKSLRGYGRCNHGVVIYPQPRTVEILTRAGL